MHDPVKFRSFAINWYKKNKDLMPKENRPDMKKYLHAQGLHVEKCDTACIRHWNISTLKMKKITKEEKI